MIIPFEIPCVILSGGKSSRMGEDKSLLPFSSSNSLIEYQFERLKPHFKDIYISSKSNKFNFLNSNNLILDENKEIFSPILALQTILETIKDEKVFIIAVDTPFVKIETIKELISKSLDFDITIAQTPLKTHNLCGVFSKNILNRIKNMIKDDIHKINYLVRNSKYNILDFQYEDEFLNINSQEDYYKSLQIIR
ncbi:molybdenum cofactor guanylyltransferase MobA [Aliarcobacter vitoriensis]|uniref:Probable molybdenum cofactor guanylyltransferase n=1 Tax=Aliarcobacter vitoriensis TaxID=2011099 RepID=A0A366MQK4_9BACT|nr:molybdenum cofactor guanylyltransferase MobA [Aliarcobacter vitoriensis]RBQ28525.1 molybdenum cofactor guanylyltransferase [Aliarcobacter vitoriensis]